MTNTLTLPQLEKLYSKIAKIGENVEEIHELLLTEVPDIDVFLAVSKISGDSRECDGVYFSKEEAEQVTQRVAKGYPGYISVSVWDSKINKLDDSGSHFERFNSPLSELIDQLINQAKER